MVVIRLARGGAKKRPAYKIVVADSRKPRDGGFIEHIGFARMGARGKEMEFELDLERYTHWCGRGANPSDAVKRLVRRKAKALKSEAAATPGPQPEGEAAQEPKEGAEPPAAPPEPQAPAPAAEGEQPQP